jgi:oligopeptidase A
LPGRGQSVGTADERLRAKYKAIAKNAACGGSASSLTPARKQALSNAMRDFVLAGAGCGAR